MIDPETEYYLKAEWDLNTQSKVCENPYIFELINHSIIDIMNDELSHLTLDCESKYWLCKEWLYFKHIRVYDLMKYLTDQFRKEIQEEIDNEILAKMRLIATQESSRPTKSGIFNWFKSISNRLFS